MFYVHIFMVLSIYIYNWWFPCVIPEDFCNAEGRSTREGALSLVCYIVILRNKHFEEFSEAAQVKYL